MNRLLFLCLAIVMAACLNEENIDLASPHTFTKFYSDGYINEPIAIEELSDGGFVMLVNSSIRDSEADAFRDKVTLIRTDRVGNQVWKQYFPPFPDAGVSDTARWKGYSLTIIENKGYLVTGESINSQDGKSYLLTMKTDSVGENMFSKVHKTAFGAYSTVGRAATIRKTNYSSNGNYLFLAASTDPAGQMIVGELRRTDLTVDWSLSRGSDFRSTLTNRLFYNINGDSLIYWGGTVTKSSAEKSDIRFTKNPVKAANPAGDPNLGYTSSAEAANDMCLSGNVFAFVGSRDVSVAGNNRNIFFFKGTSGLDTLSYKYDFVPANKQTGFINDKNEEGNSISPTKDGGYIILATIDTYTGVVGRGNTDILLLKVNGFGGYQWSMPYGSLDADAGVSVRQTSDGGYIVLARTRLAGTNTVMLMKTDKDGDVD